MTYKEYEERLNTLQNEEYGLHRSIISSLNEKYKDFIGKKVALKGKPGIAYFEGFKKDFYGISVYFNKVKKDGTESYFSADWFIPKSCYDNLDMEIVNE